LLFVNAASPVIFGCSGLTLTPEEKDFFTQNQPLGFILFKRNIQDKPQLKALIEDLKATSNQPNPPILIDQEGGRVARLSSPYWFHPPAVASLVGETIEDSKRQVFESYTQIAKDLKEMGITVNCAPVLDLSVSGSDPIMGDRTFSSDPYVVADLGETAIKAMQQEGIIPVMKHIPGHGGATCDSHKALPVISLSFEKLRNHFLPFKLNAHCPWAMTAHIVYSAIDPHHPATESSIVIQEVIRREIGFKGFLISDDLDMAALKGPLADRATRSLEAGCDAVLHCSGNLKDMREVMKGVLPFSPTLQKKAI
jgi:beta-N-acetylhexosaminidase